MKTKNSYINKITTENNTPLHDDLVFDCERKFEKLKKENKWLSITCNFEAPLQKGRGQYTTIVGYIDIGHYVNDGN